MRLKTWAKVSRFYTLAETIKYVRTKKKKQACFGCSISEESEFGLR